MSPCSWLKMALPYPSLAPVLSSIRWRLLEAAVTVVTLGWSITTDQLGALPREVWWPLVSSALSRKHFKCTLQVKTTYICLIQTSSFCFGWFDLVKFIYLVILYLQEVHQHVKGQNDWWVSILLFSSCHRSPFNWKMWRERLRLLIFCQTHFPQIIPFMVGWLRTLLWRFPYLTWGLWGSDWMFF